MNFKPFHSELIRKQFPQFSDASQRSNSIDPFIYLDSAATTQKPKIVLDTLLECYQAPHTNVHRGQYQGSQSLTDQYESARATVQSFINAKHHNEIIWTSGATDSLNLIAYSYARHHLKQGDHIFISQMEHHSNLLPWFEIAKLTGALIQMIPLTANGQLDIDHFKSNLSHKTKIVAITQMSNVTGATTDIAQITALAHAYHAVVVVDGAQGIAHLPTDVQALDIDFYAFSGHKLYATNGIGVLYAKSSLLAQMKPWRVGGKTINHMSFNNIEYSKPPHCFEAGTPNISGVLTLACAIKWIAQYNPLDLKKHYLSLSDYTHEQLKQIKSIELLYPQPHSPIIIFNHKEIHFTDIALLLAGRNIAIRSGRHCAHPLFEWMNISGCLRLSFGIYNSYNDIDQLITGLKEAIEICN